MKDLDEAAYIQGIKIYKDRSRCLIGLSQSTYLDKVLKKFKMDQAKKGFLPVLQSVKLSQTQSLTTAEDREKMKVIPYASTIGSIKYAMLCTRLVVCLAKLQVRYTIGLVQSIAYFIEPMTEAQGMTFHSLSISYRGRFLSLYSTSHLATQTRTPLTVPF